MHPKSKIECIDLYRHRLLRGLQLHGLLDADSAVHYIVSMSVPNLEILTRTPDGVARATPLLFVHGAWHGAWCWDEYFLPFFAEHGYECHALSLRGHCGSEGHERLRWHRAADYVADIASVAEQLAKAPVVIGHSMGGYLTQKYLEHHAAPAAVLLNSVPSHGVWRISLRTLSRFPLHFLRLNLRLSLWPLMETPTMAQYHLFSDTMPAAEVARYQAQLQDESFLGYLDMMLFDLPRPKRVRTPLLVIGGAKDRIFSPDEVNSTARAYNTTARIFPNVAHDAMLEKDWRAVASLILEWLNSRGL